MTEKHGSPIESLGDDRKKGFEDLEKKGFKESRIRGVKWRKAEDRIQKSEVRRQEKVRGLEGWLHLYPSKHLIFSEKKGIAIHLTF
ncbi:MAG: hypothetical protein BWX58_00152 [Deltaproteobacteria bacterium ADurb.Bin026]|jgi:hypothetical protein|nr:MAG: hypothetical protein BWX58_00152 [Deltaproteobacteria bacterium ADurb.Bin026]